MHVSVTESELERIPNPTPEDEKEETEETKEGEESGGEAAITQLTKELTWPLLNMSFTVSSNVITLLLFAIYFLFIVINRHEYITQNIGHL